MFAHKEISHKVHRPTRSENARHILVWVYRERCEHILYAFWASYTLCLCRFCAAKASLRSSSAITPFCVLISQKRRACVRLKRLRIRDEDLTVICERTEKKTKPEFQLGRLPWKARAIKLQCVPRLKHYNFQYLELHTEPFFLTSFCKNSVRKGMCLKLICINMYLEETVYQMT